MKSIVLAVLVLAISSFSFAEDDGQYRPELYGGDDGKYRPSKEGFYYDPYHGSYKIYTALDNKYKSLLAKNGKYDSFYTAYQPVYVKEYDPYQQFLTPFVKYGDQNSLDPYITSPVTVTYRPPVVPVVPSVHPFVYSSTPQPVVYASTPKPVFASSVEPIAYASAPKAVFASSVKPIVYSSTAKPVIHSATAKSIYTYPVYAKTFKDYEANARIIKQDNDIDQNGYHYAYETENGINAEEAGAVGSGGTKARGFYEYIGDNGLKYRVDYTADENGFRPNGAHLPQ
ncbi:unnamed protein product [Diatraea saccharalis]|uniref:Uncharacterized protein n=1 Tax=Diatraea saccharalis TaxID=40085 RepID=A0A9N9WA20_9NEOP|nr:unnamed protein product [Diatraea saccharalis]